MKFGLTNGCTVVYRPQIRKPRPCQYRDRGFVDLLSVMVDGWFPGLQGAHLRPDFGASAYSGYAAAYSCFVTGRGIWFPGVYMLFAAYSAY
jgi:hypothetical protein